MKNEDDYYDILGVSEDASASEIRRAYLDLSRQYHPDKHPDASTAERKAYTEAFQIMNQAYEVLRDDRELYDVERMYKKQAKAKQSGFPEYHDTKPSTKKTAPSRNESPKAAKPAHQESKSEKNEREQKTEKEQQKPKKTSHSSAGSNAREPPTFGTRADGQPCRRCQMYGKFCFQHEYQDPRSHTNEQKNGTSANQQQHKAKKASKSSSGNDAREKPTFGTRADGEPCRRCQMYGKYCFHHVHQDPRFHKNEQRNSTNQQQQKAKKPSQSSSGNNAREPPTFGTRSDGQPCRRCQMQKKFCFQHENQDPRFHKNEQNHHHNAKQQPKAKKPSHPHKDSHARGAPLFGTRADGQPCRRCQMQNKYCFQHVSQDPLHV